MSRILKALKQIEAVNPPPWPSKPPSRPKTVRPLPKTTPEEPPADETSADEPSAEETSPSEAAQGSPPSSVASAGTVAAEVPPPEQTPACPAPEAPPGTASPVGEDRPEEGDAEQTLPSSRPSAADESDALQREQGPHQAPSDEAPSLEDEIRDLLEGPAAGDSPGFRELAANILAQLAPGEPAAVLFTSPEDGAGKTATVAPLATLLAERIRGGVLAVDCNLQRPQLAGHLGISVRLGLAAVLRGSARWQDFVRRSPASDTLRVLPAETAAPGGEAPVDFSSLGPLLDEMRLRFRLVLLDAASLAHPEVATLARFCEGACLVVRLGQTTRREAEAAVRILQESGTRLLGSVVTCVAPDRRSV